jgi:hypothetical protein
LPRVGIAKEHRELIGFHFLKSIGSCLGIKSSKKFLTLRPTEFFKKVGELTGAKST